MLQPLMMLSWSRFTRLEKENAPLDDLRRTWLDNMGVAAAILWPPSRPACAAAHALVVRPRRTCCPRRASCRSSASPRSASGPSSSGALDDVHRHPAPSCASPGSGPVELLVLLLVFGRSRP
ncbi:MAG: hypothetical protein ACE368_15635 [Paracoccaceae bacterium]